MAIQVNDLTLLCLVKRKDGEWDVPTHHSKNASTQYMTYVRVMRLKKKILKHVSFFVQSTIKENISL